jgi:hypothetical protein
MSSRSRSTFRGGEGESVTDRGRDGSKVVA